MTYHPDMTSTEAKAALTPWLEIVANHNCDHCESMLDAAILASRELAEEVGSQDATIERQASELTYRAVIIAHQARSIVALRAEIARLRTDPARTPTEALVDRLSRLQPWYAFEKE